MVHAVRDVGQAMADSLDESAQYCKAYLLPQLHAYTLLVNKTRRADDLCGKGRIEPGSPWTIFPLALKVRVRHTNEDGKEAPRFRNEPKLLHRPLPFEEVFTDENQSYRRVLSGSFHDAVSIIAGMQTVFVHESREAETVQFLLDVLCQNLSWTSVADEDGVRPVDRYNAISMSSVSTKLGKVSLKISFCVLFKGMVDVSGGTGGLKCCQ